MRVLITCQSACSGQKMCDEAIDLEKKPTFYSSGDDVLILGFVPGTLHRAVERPNRKMLKDKPGQVWLVRLDQAVPDPLSGRLITVSEADLSYIDSSDLEEYLEGLPVHPAVLPFLGGDD